MNKWHKNPLPGPLGVCLGWALKHFRVETLLGVKRQLLCQFGHLTPAFMPVLAFWRQNFYADLECRFGPSNLGQSMDYHILLESPGCLLSNAIERAPIGLLKLQKIHFECREVRIQQHLQSFLVSESDFCSGPSISARKYLKSQKNTQTHSKVQKCEFCLKTNKNILKTVWKQCQKAYKLSTHHNTKLKLLLVPQQLKIK